MSVEMEEPFRIIPAGWLPLWGLVPILALLGFVMGVMVFAVVSAQRATFEVTDKALRLRGELYSRDIPLELLQPQAARIIDLRSPSQSNELQPVRRSFGTHLPGYQAGWFKLRNGRRALVYLTDRRQVVYIPTTDDYVVLLSVQEPQAFLAALRQAAQP